MLVGRIATPFDVPVFDAANNVTWISSTEHDLGLISRFLVRIVQQDVEPPAGLKDLFMSQQREFAET